MDRINFNTTDFSATTNTQEIPRESATPQPENRKLTASVTGLLSKEDLELVSRDPYFFANLDSNAETDFEATMSKFSTLPPESRKQSASDACLEDLEPISRHQSEDPDHPVTADDFFANFDLDTASDSTAISIQGTPQQPESRKRIASSAGLDQDDFEPMSTNALSTPPPENQNQPQDFSNNDIAHVASNEFTIITLPQSPTIDRRGGNLSEISVDFDELEPIPEDFVIPMLNEDGTPTESDNGSGTPTNSTNGNTQDDAMDIDPPAPNIRDLMIEVQGDDNDVHMENDFFDARAPRTALIDITIASPFHNGARPDFALTPYLIIDRATRALQARQVNMARIYGDPTTPFWSRSHSIVENLQPSYVNERIESEREREERDRVWARERDEMIFHWNQERVNREEWARESVREERAREEIARRERVNLVMPNNSWTRSMR